MKQLRYLYLAIWMTVHTAAIAQDTLKMPDRPGTVLQQTLRVSDNGQVAELPVKVIRGVKNGPVFTIIAGIHGFEYPPIMAVQQVMSEIRPEALSGTLIIIPIANTAAFYGRSVFVNPQDGKNLNRVFPGNARGTITERLAHLITTQIINRSEVVLDIHAGDASEDLADFVCYYNNQATPEATARAASLAEVSDFPYRVIYPFDLKEGQPAEYAFKQATRQGITALSFEAGKLGNVQPESVNLVKNGVYNLLDELNMYTADTKKQHLKGIEFNRQTYIKSPGKGIFYSKLKSGESVTKGQDLGYITDLFGKKMNSIAATESGVILYKIGTPPVLEGETLFCIGH